MNEIDFNWLLAEQDLQRDEWGYDCPGCARAKRQVARQGDVAYCDVHRCRGKVQSGHHAGERCRHHVSGVNPLYCDKHGCGFGWAKGHDYLAGCANAGTMQAVPDGRRVRICGQHHQMMHDQSGQAA